MGRNSVVVDDKQQRMYEWLIDRIAFAMHTGGLTELHCNEAVLEAERKLTEFKEQSGRTVE
jgi:hypothetical protein